MIGDLKKIIMFSFFKKSMASRTNNLNRAGLPESTKISTAVNEIHRRLKNTSRELETHETETVLREYMTELRWGGYPQVWREEVLGSAIKGYIKLWKLEIEGKGHINRPQHTTQLKRRAQKLEGAMNWFREAPKTQQREKQHQYNRKNPLKWVQQPTESILFIPYTPQSALKKILQQLEKQVTGNKRTGKVRIVERAGPTIADILCNKAPWTSEWCNRQGCKPCEAKPGSCRSLNLVYQIPCLDCKALGKRATYIGETHRSFWDRTQEHLADIRSKNSKNSLVKHWEEVHGDQQSPPKYSFQVKKKCKSAIERQIWEALFIEVENSQGDYQINSKAEFGINLMPKLKPILQEDDTGAQNHKKRSNQQVHQPKPGPPDADMNGFELQYSQRVKRRKLNMACNTNEIGNTTTVSLKAPGDKGGASDH